jgi:hypothetical protein
MLICICDFFDHALMPEQKEHEKQKARERQQRKRERDREGMSRRDADPVSRPPDPVPDPVLNDHDLDAPRKTPSPPADVAVNQPTSEEFRREYEARWEARHPGRRFRWTDEHRSYLAEVERLAAEVPGSLPVALDAFFADTSQRQYGHVPRGLVIKWWDYTGEHRAKAERHKKVGRAALSELNHQREKAKHEGRPVPRSLADLPPCERQKVEQLWPELDLASIRVAKLINGRSPIAKSSVTSTDFRGASVFNRE